MNLPKVGDKVYIDSSFYIGHGEDDVLGGIATIIEVEVKECSNPFNTISVRVAENPRCSYNYQYLMEKQNDLREEFGSQVAYPDPDYNDYGDRW